ncbi:hypothetical protein JMJ35_010444 [Cladonia borealis]|uniref:Uncharacterized protein n=1 Tax=Cladonia borealis TaxID=184061 RepID=A0AA39QS24_9LECA|nr:hypothetical protein JMJ35_010444 [Cladonia borealis]
MPDYSTSITLVNNLPCKLTLVSKSMSDGYWDTAPPDTVNANSTVTFKAKDSVGFYGSKGSFTYKIVDDTVEKTVQLSCNFDDPTGDNDNVCDAGTDVLKNLYKVDIRSFPKRDHPLKVTITLSYKDISFNMTITNLYLVNAVTSILNSKDKLIVYSPGVYDQSKAVEIWNHDWSDDTVKDASYSGVQGSYDPVSTDALRGSADLLAKLSYDDNLNDIPLKLVGTMNRKTVVDTGSQKLYHNKETPLLTFPAKNAGTAWGIGGDISWQLTLQPTGKSASLCSTRVEIYGLNKSLPKFYNNGVPVKLLRWVVMPAPSKLSEYTVYVANSVFSKTGFKFDSINGASGFGVTALGANFNVSTWLKLMNSNSSYRVNQYDQTAAVQVSLALAPFSSNPANQWVYLTPYGYINTTQIIGWSGNCNNPLFKEKTDKMELKTNDTDRTAFVDYTFFLSSSSNVVDATIGPYTGTQSVSSYLDATLDKQTNLYLDESKKPQTWGEASDAKYSSGLDTLDSVAASSPTSSSPALRSPLYTARIEKLMDLAINLTDRPPALPSLSDFRALEHHLISSFSNSKLLHSTTRLSPVCSETQICLDLGPVDVLITVTVFHDHNGAVRGMADHLVTYSAPIDTLFARPEAGKVKEKGQLTLSTVADSALHRTLWVRDNKFITAASLTEGFNGIEALAEKLDGFFEDGEAPSSGDGEGENNGAEQAAMPVLRGLHVVREKESDQIGTGEQFSVFADIDGCGLARVSTSTSAIHLIDQDLTQMKFTFQALESGRAKIFFIFMHQSSHRVICGDLEVEVVDN